MAKPRIFVSSTYYDLKHVRNSLENFIVEMGYEPILFESGDIPFKHDLTLDESCYKEIENAHIQILILGGRYGSAESKTAEKSHQGKDKMYDFYNSITKIEYKTALDKGIPVFIFVEKQVLAEYDTYKRNRENVEISYAHVDSVNIFKLIDEIYSQRTGNYIKGFEKFDDIANWLKEQWAGLFADFLKNNRNKIEIKTLSSKISELGSLTNALKEYTEAIMKEIKPENYKQIIESEDKKIENEKAFIFSQEPLISYVLLESKGNLDSIEAFNCFKASETLEEFITKTKSSEKVKTTVLSDLRRKAEEEFKYLKFNYQSINYEIPAAFENPSSKR